MVRDIMKTQFLMVDEAPAISPPKMTQSSYVKLPKRSGVVSLSVISLTLSVFSIVILSSSLITISFTAIFPIHSSTGMLQFSSNVLKGLQNPIFSVDKIPSRVSIFMVCVLLVVVWLVPVVYLVVLQGERVTHPLLIISIVSITFTVTAEEVPQSIKQLVILFNDVLFHLIHAIFPVTWSSIRYEVVAAGVS